MCRINETKTRINKIDLDENGFWQEPSTIKNLYDTIVDNDLNSLTLLARNGFDFNQFDDAQFEDLSETVDTTPLVLAIDCGYTDMVEALIIAGADVNLKVNEREPIYYAMSNDDTEMVKILVQYGANTKELKQAIKQYGEKILYYFNVDLEEINTTSEIIFGKEEYTKLCKAQKKKKKINILDKLYKNILSNNYEAVEKFVKNEEISDLIKYCINFFTDFTEIEFKGSLSQIKMMLTLLNSDYDITKYSCTGHSPYHDLIMSEKINQFALVILSLKMDISSEINYVGNDGFNAIHRAINDCDLFTLCALLTAGGNPNQATQEGKSPYILAFEAKSNSTEMIYVLSKYGVNLREEDIKTINSYSPDAVSKINASLEELDLNKINDIIDIFHKDSWEKILGMDIDTGMQHIKELVYGDDLYEDIFTQDSVVVNMNNIYT